MRLIEKVCELLIMKKYHVIIECVTGLEKNEELSTLIKCDLYAETPLKALNVLIQEIVRNNPEWTILHQYVWDYEKNIYEIG